MSCSQCGESIGENSDNLCPSFAIQVSKQQRLIQNSHHVFNALLTHALQTSKSCLTHPSIRRTSSCSRWQSIELKCLLVCFALADFETICGQGVPPPWVEEHGIYAIMVSCDRTVTTTHTGLRFETLCATKTEPMPKKELFCRLRSCPKSS